MFEHRHDATAFFQPRPLPNDWQAVAEWGDDGTIFITIINRSEAEVGSILISEGEIKFKDATGRYRYDALHVPMAVQKIVEVAMSVRGS